MIKQYVNLPQDPDEHHGRSLPLVAEASDISDEEATYAEWWLEPGPNNTDERYLRRQRRAHLRQTVTRNNDDHFQNVVVLPHVGGDRYDVKCSKRNDRGSAVTLDTIETWRKIYFSMFNMNAACESYMNSIKGPMTSAIEDVFVEMEEDVTTRTQTEEDETEYRDGLRHYFQYPGNDDPMHLPNRPFHLRILTIHRLYNPTQQAYDETTTHVVHYQDTLRDLTDHNWLISARARLRPGGAWRDVSAQAARVSSSRFSIDLADQTEFWDGVHDDGGSIQLQVTTREKRMLAGGSIGNMVIIAILKHDGTQQDSSNSISTLVHELGHAFSQAVHRERLYNDHGSPSGWEINAMHHDDTYGGLGDHCNKNCRLANAPSGMTSSGQWYIPNSGQTTCVMYRQMHDNCGQEYCEQCLPRTKRANLERATLNARNWNSF